MCTSSHGGCTLPSATAGGVAKNLGGGINSKNKTAKKVRAIIYCRILAPFEFYLKLLYLLVKSVTHGQWYAFSCLITCPFNARSMITSKTQESARRTPGLKPRHRAKTRRCSGQSGHCCGMIPWLIPDSIRQCGMMVQSSRSRQSQNPQRRAPSTHGFQMLPHFHHHLLQPPLLQKIAAVYSTSSNA